MFNFTVEDKLMMHKYVMDEIGIYLEQGKYLKDQDTGEQIYYEGKPLVYSLDPNRPVFDTDDSVLFDLINNLKIGTTIFAYYIEKEKAIGNIKDVQSFYQLDSEDKKGISMSALGVKLDRGFGLENLSSDYFYSTTLKWPDMILKLGNIPYNLHVFDEAFLYIKKNSTGNKIDKI